MSARKSFRNASPAAAALSSSPVVSPVKSPIVAASNAVAENSLPDAEEELLEEEMLDETNGVDDDLPSDLVPHLDEEEPELIINEPEIDTILKEEEDDEDEEDDAGAESGALARANNVIYENGHDYEDQVLSEEDDYGRYYNYMEKEKEFEPKREREETETEDHGNYVRIKSSDMCTFCNRNFDEKSHWLVHGECYFIRIQVDSINRGEGAFRGSRWTFRCEFCSKLFPDKGQLRQHLTFHFDKTFICKLCGHESYNSQAMENHQDTHGSHHNNASAGAHKFRTSGGGLVSRNRGQNALTGGGQAPVQIYSTPTIMNYDYESNKVNTRSRNNYAYNYSEINDGEGGES